MSILQPGSKVLVTGVTGFIGSHVANLLLEAGYTVRGTSRTPASGQWLVDLLDKKYGKGKIEIVAVPDMTATNAYDEAVKGVSGIAHLATVGSATEGFDSDPNKVITPVVASTVNILSSASKEKGVKSVVLTASSAGTKFPPLNEHYTFDENTFNDDAIEAAWNKSDVDGFTVYGASKAAGEKRFFEVAKETQVPYQVATVVPNANFGTILKPQGELSASTGTWPVMLYKGDTDVIFNFPPQWFVNVDDTAKLHVIALTDPTANRRRLFAYSEPYTWSSLAKVIKKLRPNYELPNAPDVGEDLGKVPNEFASSLLKKHYGHGFTGIEESLKQNLATLE